MSRPSEHHLGDDLMAVAEGGDTLDDARRAELMAHVEGCPDCRAAVASAKQVLSAVDALPRVEPTPAFDQGLAARLDEIDRLGASGAGWSERVWAFFTLPRLAGVGLAAAAAVALFLAVRPPVGEVEEAVGALPPALAANLEVLDLAEDLDLYQDMDVVEYLDVLDDLDVIGAMEEGEAG